MLFAAYYLLHDYESLAEKYIRLKSCIYRVENWSQDFFTTGVKAQGNILNLLVLAIGTSVAWYSVRRLRSVSPVLRTFYQPVSYHWGYRVLLVGTGLGFWWFSHSLTQPAYDEIFSAVHCAGMHPFQAVSYYMLPNNHLLFNLLNSFLPLSVEDKVMSGRLISLMAFLVTQQMAFSLLKQKMSLWFAIGIVLMLSLSLPTLGFASQARGYSLQLLAGWTVVAGLWHHYQKGDVCAGYWLLVGTVAGYALLPSFLFFHVAVVLFAIAIQWQSGRMDRIFWKYQLLAGAFTLMFYLPALSFSGVEAFTANKYVRADDKSLWEFAGQFAGLFDFFMNYAFSSIFTEKSNLILYTLYLLPLSLAFSKERKNRAIALFYLLMWGSVIVVVLWMKKIPFSRNLIVQYSISLSVIAYAAYYWLHQWNRRENVQKAASVVFGGSLILISLIFVMRFREIAGEQLYFNSANKLYEANSRGVATLPPNTLIGYSHESFYWYFLSRKAGLDARLCPEGSELFLVKRAAEQFPEEWLKNYELYAEPTGEDYEIWKLK